MSKEVFKEIKNVLNIISVLQLREKTFREELEFFKQNYEKQNREYSKSLYIGALKRLENEVGFLCVDVYSLYQGIEKKKSLYSKLIKQHGKLLSTIDKTPSDRNTYSFGGIIDSEGIKREFTSEEKNDLIKKFEQKAYNSREKLRLESGITSHKHDDLDQWVNKILDDRILLQLSQYRKEFAHRLDSLENLKRELQFRHPQSIQEMLGTISTALKSYQDCFRAILGYTKSQHYLGIKGIKYDSLSRLKLAERIIKQRKVNKEYFPNINIEET